MKPAFKISDNAIIYGVRYIEVESVERPEGWSLYANLNECKEFTSDAKARGSYSDERGYYGPARPLCAIEIPFYCLEVELQQKMRETSRAQTSSRWSPKFTGNKINIES